MSEGGREVREGGGEGGREGGEKRRWEKERKEGKKGKKRGKRVRRKRGRNGESEGGRKERRKGGRKERRKGRKKGKEEGREKGKEEREGGRKGNSSEMLLLCSSSYLTTTYSLTGSYWAPQGKTTIPSSRLCVQLVSLGHLSARCWTHTNRLKNIGKIRLHNNVHTRCSTYTTVQVCIKQPCFGDIITWQKRGVLVPRLSLTLTKA